MDSRLQRKPGPTGPAAAPAPKAAIYTRVSTDMQVEAESLRTQEKQLRDYCAYHQVDVYDLYTDAGLSGAHTENRPAFQRMMRDAEQGKFQVVVVAKVDRISRNLSDLLELIHELEAWHVDFVSISQQFDTSTPMGRLTLNILGSFAQFERDIIAERTRENMLERAKRGMWNGGVVPYGYKAEDDKLVIAEDEAQHVRRMFYEYPRLRSLRAVAVLLNAAGAKSRYDRGWSSVGVKRTLQNPAYKGVSQYNKRRSAGLTLVERPESEWIVVENVLPVIVDAAQWDEVNRLIGMSDGIHHGAKTSEYLLAGIVRCGKCGAHMQGRQRAKALRGRRTKTYTYYLCGGRAAKGSVVCDHAMHRATDVDGLVVDALAGIARDPTNVIRQAEAYLGTSAHDVDRLHEDHEAISTSLAEANTRLQRLTESVENGVFEKTEIAARVRSVRAERDILHTRLEQINTRLTAIVGGSLDPDNLSKRFDVFREAFGALTLAEKKLLLQNVVDHVVVHEDGSLDIFIYLPVVQGAMGAVGGYELTSAADPATPLTRITVATTPAPLPPLQELGPVGARITHLRERAGLTKKELAVAVGATACTVANWERRGMIPEVPRGRVLAQVLGVSYGELVDMPSPSPDATPAERLRQLRLWLGYGQKEFAALVGLSVDAYVYRESGDGSRVAVDEAEYQRLRALALRPDVDAEGHDASRVAS